MADHETPGADPLDGRLLAAWRDLTPEDHRREAPPASAWDGIESRLAAEDGNPAAVAGVTPLPSARRRPPLGRWVLGAAALVLVGLVASVVLLDGSGDRTIQSRAALTTEGLPIEPGPHGSARLVADGEQVRLDVALADLPELGTDEVLEVWLIDPDSGGLQSLGLTDGSTTLLVPAAVDTTQFSLVDVSVEPTDGDPTHSSESVVRGGLEPV